MSETIQLRERGVLTLPKSLRDQYGLEEGATLHLVDLNGTFLLTPMVPMVPQLAQEIERMRTEAGLSTEDLLRLLRAEREALTAERYGSEPGGEGAQAADASDA